MRGRPILVEYQGKPRSLREVGRLIGVSPRAMVDRYARYLAGKIDEAALFAPRDEKSAHRGTWGEVGDVVETQTV